MIVSDNLSAISRLLETGFLDLTFEVRDYFKNMSIDH